MVYDNDTAIIKNVVNAPLDNHSCTIDKRRFYK